jgi:hypothetical protein
MVPDFSRISSSVPQRDQEWAVDVRVTASAAATVPFSYHGVDMSNPDVVARVSRELADLDASAAEFDYELKGYYQSFIFFDPTLSSLYYFLLHSCLIA